MFSGITRGLSIIKLFFINKYLFVLSKIGLFIKFISGKIASFFSLLFIKLTSVSSIKKAFEFISKVFGAIKKFFSNKKVLKAIKILLTLTIIALSIMQFVKHLNYIIDTFIPFDKQLLKEYDFVICAVLFVGSWIAIVTYCLFALMGLFRKKTEFKFNFISSMLIFYVIGEFLKTQIDNQEYIGLYTNTFMLKWIFLAIGIFAFFRLFNDDFKKRIISIIISLVCVALIYLIYIKCGFIFIRFNVVNEMSFSVEKLSFSRYISTVLTRLSGNYLSVYENVICSCSEIVAEESLALKVVFQILSGIMIFMENVFPYLMLSLIIYFAIVIVSNKNGQYENLYKINRILKSVILAMIIFVISIILETVLFASKNVILVELETKNIIFSAVGIIVLAILTDVAKRILTAQNIKK